MLHMDYVAAVVIETVLPGDELHIYRVNFQPR